MLNLASRLDVIFEEVRESPVGDAVSLAAKIQRTKQQVLDLQHELEKVIRRMCSDLALSVRRREPAFNVSIDKNGCKIGYKTKCLLFTPNPEKELWEVTSANERFCREFIQTHRRSLILNPTLESLTEAIVNHFTAYFRTLGEEVCGTGIIMVDEKKATLGTLAEYQASSRPLMTRARIYGSPTA
jgi:nucleotidyltransferase/DNA polymerase involved in DNA repair